MVFAAGANGWTETWYTTAGDRTTAVQRCNALAMPRVQMLGFGCRYEATRVSDIAIQFDSYLSSNLIAQPPGGAGALAPVENARDDVWTAMLLNITSGIYRRSFLMRGLPDDEVYLGLDGVMRFAPGFGIKLQAWGTALEQNQFALRCIDRSAANPLQMVTTVSEDPQTATYRFTIPGLVLAVGDEFIVYNSNNPPILKANGTHRVQSIGASGEITTYTPWDGGVSFIYRGLGSARKKVIIFPTIDGSEYRSIRKRDTGRRIFVTAGRR